MNLTINHPAFVSGLATASVINRHLHVAFGSETDAGLSANMRTAVEAVVGTVRWGNEYMDFRDNGSVTLTYKLAT